jgi:coatomer subunit beta
MVWPRTAPLQALHGCAVKFPDVAASVVHLLMDFLGDANTVSAIQVAADLRLLRQGVNYR